MLKGVSSIIEDRLKLGPKYGKNVMSGELTRYKTIMKHYRRWQAVDYYRTQKEKTFSSAYRAAEKVLKGSFAKGTLETIRKSYWRVRKELKDPIKKHQYYDATREAHALTGTPAINFT